MNTELVVDNSMTFIEMLMQKIITGACIPKVQVERYISPILEIYIEDILEEKYNNKYKLISSEFPLKKDKNCQSTNIDFLLVNTSQNKFTFVELKTDLNSYNVKQNDLYLNLGCERLGEKLEGNLTSILKATAKKYRHKYEYLINKWKNTEFDLNKISDYEIIYLVPFPIKTLIAGEVLAFKDLPESLGTRKFNDEWKMIRKYLLELDKNVDEKACGKEIIQY